MSSMPESQVKRLSSKREKFVRSSSLEKIMRFNTYICSQNYYYILPAILAWVKTSQTILQSTIKKTIRFFKSLFYISIVYRVIEMNLKTVRSNKLNFFSIKPEDVVTVTKLLMGRTLPVLKDTFFVITVYVSFVAIYLQLLLCVYFMCLVDLPGGFLFLITCLLITCHMCYQQSCNHIKTSKALSQKNKQPNRTRSEALPRPRLSRKEILGNRTISTFNLF